MSHPFDENRVKADTGRREFAITIDADMVSPATHGDVRTSLATRSMLRRCLVAAFVLLCVAGLLQTGQGVPQVHPRTDDTRIKAASEASGLLLMTPPLATATPGPAANVATVPDIQLPPPSTLPPTVEPGLKDRALIEKPAAAGMRVNTRLSRLIPAAIEGGLGSPQMGDALQTATIISSLRVYDGVQVPLEVQATQVEGGRPGVTMRIRHLDGGAMSITRWLAAGESPLPGWTIVSIGPAEILLLSPRGNPVRLHAMASGSTAR